MSGEEDRRRVRMIHRSEIGKEGHTPPPVFFVRVANTGLMLDAARKSGK